MLTADEWILATSVATIALVVMLAVRDAVAYLRSHEEEDQESP